MIDFLLFFKDFYLLAFSLSSLSPPLVAFPRVLGGGRQDELRPTTSGSTSWCGSFATQSDRLV